MGKGRTGMNEVSVYMDARVRVWEEREKGELATYLACALDLGHVHMYDSNSQLTS